MTRIENADAPFAAGKAVHFCPGSAAARNGTGRPTIRRPTSIYIGEVEWCTTVTLKPTEKIEAVKPATPWSGKHRSIRSTSGASRTVFDWAGWVYAVDADTGAWKWRVKTNYPDPERHDADGRRRRVLRRHGRQFLRARRRDGRKLWGQKIGGAIGGGVITYRPATSRRSPSPGLTEILWPTEITTAKVSMLGLE